LWEIATGRVLRSFTGHTHAVQSVAFGTDGQTAFSAGGIDGTVRVWNLRTGQQVQSLHENTDPVKCVIPLPDGRHIVSAGGDVVHGDHGAFQAYGCAIHVWDLSTGKIVQNLEGHTLPVMSLACSPDGTRLVSGDLGGALCLWDLARAGTTAKEIAKIDGHNNWIRGTAFSADGTSILSASADHMIKLWKLP
jgi:WD40 repeat protein